METANRTEIQTDQPLSLDVLKETQSQAKSQNKTVAVTHKAPTIVPPSSPTAETHRKTVADAPLPSIAVADLPPTTVITPLYLAAVTPPTSPPSYCI